MANFGPSKTWTDGEILSHTDLNAALLDIINNVTNNNIDADNIDETDDYTWSGANSFTGGHSIKVLSNAASSIVTGTTLEWDPGDGGQMTDNSSGISLDFKLPDASDNQDVFASIAAICLDDAAGSEDGELSFRVATAGTNTEKMTLSSTALTVTPAITASGGITGSVTSSNVSITGGSITGITDIAIADGGTGASTAAAARANLGLEIGVDVQAYDAELQALSGLTPTDSNIIVGNGSTFVTESGATARTSLGLGSIATQNANAVSITGGSLTGMTSYSGGTISGSTGSFTSTISTSGGYVTVAGNPSASAIGSNGNGQIGGLTGNGLFMYGKGSTYDLALANANTSVALAIPTSGSATPDVYIPNSLGIGTNSPSESLTNRGNVFIETNSTSADSGNGLFWQSTTSGWSTSSAHAAIYGKRTDASNGYLRFDTRQSGTTQEAMRLTSAGLLGLGTDSPSHTLDVNGSVQIERNGSSPLLRFTDTSSSSRWIGIPDGSSRFAIYGTNGSTEELVLDASGNIGLGTSSPSSYSSDARNLVIASSGNGGMTIKSGSTSTGNLFFANAEASAANNGIIQYDHNTNEFAFNNYGSSQFYSFSIQGSEKLRINSDGITFNGDTSSDNALSDFETGSFTPTLGGTTTDPTATYSVQAGTYTKVGNLVTVTVRLATTALTGGAGFIKIQGLPYTQINSSDKRTSTYTSVYNVNVDANCIGVAIEGAANATFFYMLESKDNTIWSNVDWTQVTSSSFAIWFTAQYYV